jgi:dUTP pyrophosphatase
MFTKLREWYWYARNYNTNRKITKQLKKNMELEKTKDSIYKSVLDRVLKKTTDKPIKINCHYIPQRKTEGAAAYDLTAKLDTPFITFRANESHTISTGLRIEIPEGKVGLIFLRSGIAQQTWLGLANSVGVIDSDYRGEILLNIRNYSPTKRYMINNNDRIAQLVIVDYFAPTLINSKVLSTTVRGTGGFGSTGAR